MAAIGKCSYILLSVSLIFLISGAVLAIAWSYIFRSILTELLILKPGSKTYAIWQHTPVPLYLDLYLFNVTNQKEFEENPGITPILEEIGPFVFQEVHDRVNVTWHSNGSVSFNQTRRWNFVPEQSAASLNASITNIDVIALTTAYATRYKSHVEQTVLNFVLKKTSRVLVTKPAGQWLFDGIKLPLLDLLNSKTIESLTHIHIPFDKFGFFYKRNMSASYDGRFNMFTGKHLINQLGVINTWNDVNKTTFFEETCALVNGSSGEILPPTAPRTEKFQVFITDVCSTLTLQYSGKTIVEGVTGSHYVGDNETFSNLGANACFCDGSCPPEGIRNLTLCRTGAPIFVSFPHYYLADPKVVSDLIGVNPNKTLHELSIEFEPVTGIPLEVKARLQISALMDNYPMYELYKKAKRRYIPIVWFTQRVKITPALASQASVLASALPLYPPIIFSIIAVIGLSLMTFVFIVKFWKAKKDDQECLIEPDIGHSHSVNDNSVD